MANEFKLISTYVADGSTTGAGVTFSSIPQTYKNLQIIYTAICQNGSGLGLRWNGLTSNYSRGRLVGTANNAVGTLMAGSQVEVPMMGNVGLTTIGCGSIEFANYTASRNVNVRSFAGLATTSTNGIELNGGTNSDANPVTSITIRCEGGSNLLLAGSVFSLYGIG
jgi:hypothetical protein